MKRDCERCVHENKSPMAEPCRTCGIAMLNFEPRKPLTNADLLRAESDEGLADAIFYTLSEFPSKEALLAFLREEAKSDA